MDATSLLLAVGAGGAVSILPLLSWAQGEGTRRQMWVFIFGHLIALPVLVAMTAIKGSPSAGPLFFLVAGAAGVCSGLNGALYYAGVMHRGPMAISWVIIWLGAVIVAVAGWLFLHEAIYVAQPLALASFVACLAVMGRATARASQQAGAAQPIRRGYWAYLIAAMAVGVCGVMLIKLRPAGGSHLLFMSAHVAGLLIGLLAAAAVLRLGPLLDPRTLLVSAGWAAVVTPLYLCIVWGLAIANASIFTPTQSGTALILGVCWAMLRGERPSKLVLLGAALALASIVLINLQWHRIH